MRVEIGSLFSESKSRELIGDYLLGTQVQALREELLKASQFLNNEPAKNAKRVSNFYILCDSVSEGYKRNKVQWYVHFRAASVGAIDHRKRADLCALLEYGIEADIPVGLPSDFLGDEVAGRLPTVQSGGQDPSMLVDVAEIINQEEYVPLGVSPFVVGLQGIDRCNCAWGHSVEAMPRDLPLECFQRCTNREHVLVVGSVFCGQNKFPYQIVEGRSEIFEKISNDKWNPFGNRGTRNDFPDVFIPGTFPLSHHFCWVRLEIPLRLGVEFVEVLLSPVELALHGIRDSCGE